MLCTFILQESIYVFSFYLFQNIFVLICNCLLFLIRAVRAMNETMKQNRLLRDQNDGSSHLDSKKEDVNASPQNVCAVEIFFFFSLLFFFCCFLLFILVQFANVSTLLYLSSFRTEGIKTKHGYLFSLIRNIYFMFQLETVICLLLTLCLFYFHNCSGQCS